uniref:ABC transporter substrate-binding protein n=1 Tax=Cellulomonas citrea TaxID=1909423 RepID=UPI001F26206A
MNARPGQRIAGAALVGVLALVLAGCTGHGDQQRSTTATVAVGYAFGSLNAATSLGRTPGSTLVRGLTHTGFTSLDAAGAAVADPSFGTVEKVSDSPLTVRYTLADGVRWSDGVPVTGADLLLEWAARSGQLDEAVPTLGSDGSLTDPAALDQQVAFAATSPALVHATATPAFDAHSLTLVYDQPVADWQVALDVNLPAHVIGRLALGRTSTAAPTPQVSASGLGVTDPTSTGAAPASPQASAPAASPSAPSPSASSTDWAAAVTDAIVHDDRTALVAISRTWRTAADAGALAGDPSAAVDDGPYVITSVAPDREVVLEPNPTYSGAHRARFTRVVVRSDLAPLDQVAALGTGEVDVAAPVDTADVRAALDRLGGATVVDGDDRVLQLQVGEKSGGAFDPSSYASDGPAAAAAARAGFLGALDPTTLASTAGASASG